MDPNVVTAVGYANQFKDKCGEGIETIKNTLPDQLKSTFRGIDTKMPTEPGAKFAHIIRESLLVVTKVTTVVAVVYTVSLTFTFLKVAAITGLFNLAIYKLATSKYVDDFGKKAQQFWSTISSAKAPVVIDKAEPVKKDMIDEPIVEEPFFFADKAELSDGEVFDASQCDTLEPNKFQL